MKCRILKKGGKFYAQYEKEVYTKGGRFTRSHKEWKTLTRCGYYSYEGQNLYDWFDSLKDAEEALKEFVEEQSEGKVVKEFEL